ncbi:MAG: hypothetical protein V4726_00970 [Verrucomicrobiota bacterium]
MNIPATIGTVRRLEELEHAATGRFNRLLDFHCMPPDYEPESGRRKFNAQRRRRHRHHLGRCLKIGDRLNVLGDRVFAAGLQKLFFPEACARAAAENARKGGSAE